MTTQSDSDIVAAVIRGDREAFSVLVTRYARAAIGVAAQVLRDRHAAEDVAQEAFVVAHEKLNSLTDRHAFGSWLLQIVRRRAYRVRKRNRRILQPPDDAPEPFVTDKNFLDDNRKELLDLVARLPEHERTVVMLRYFDGHTVNDIAQINSCATGTVTKTLTRARTRLLAMLERTKP